MIIFQVVAVVKAAYESSWPFPPLSDSSNDASRDAALSLFFFFF